MQNAKTLRDTILCLEPLAYYFNLTPNEFWNGRYKEIYLYCEINVIKMQEDFKQKIILNDATTDKLIQADSLNKNAKIVPLRKMFDKIFSKK